MKLDLLRSYYAVPVNTVSDYYNLSSSKSFDSISLNVLVVSILFICVNLALEDAFF